MARPFRRHLRECPSSIFVSKGHRFVEPSQTPNPLSKKSTTHHARIFPAAHVYDWESPPEAALVLETGMSPPSGTLLSTIMEVHMGLPQEESSLPSPIVSFHDCWWEGSLTGNNGNNPRNSNFDTKITDRRTSKPPPAGPPVPGVHLEVWMESNSKNE